MTLSMAEIAAKRAADRERTKARRGENERNNSQIYADRILETIKTELEGQFVTTSNLGVHNNTPYLVNIKPETLQSEKFQETLKKEALRIARRKINGTHTAADSRLSIEIIKELILPNLEHDHGPIPKKVQDSLAEQVAEQIAMNMAAVSIERNRGEAISSYRGK